MNDPLVHTLFVVLATALLHSLWIFLVLTGLGYTILGGLKEARQRYTVSLLTLLSLPVAFGTVLLLAWWDTTSTRSVASASILGSDLASTLVNPDDLSPLSLSPNWSTYLAITYLIGLTVFAGLRIYQYGVTLRLRAGGHPPDREWLRSFHALRARVVPHRDVRWTITARVGQVLLVGVFRPVILFPIGLLTTLTPAEVEAVLLHELYHVRRYDVFWNTVQLLVVSLFFYHPMVYWLSRRIDEEREYICDDAASAATGRTTYAQALVRLAKFSLHPKITYTMPAVDHQTFTHRVQRLFGQPNRPDNSGSSLLLPLALLPLCLLLAFIPACTNDEITVAEPAVGTTVSGTVKDTETGEPLIGTSILIQNTTVGTVSDLEGNFTIQMPAGEYQLIFSYTGYQTSIESTKLNQDTDQPLNVQLVKDDKTE